MSGKVTRAGGWAGPASAASGGSRTPGPPWGGLRVTGLPEPQEKPAVQASWASSVIVVPASAWLTGHPLFARSAAAVKSAADIPGTLP